jgi:DNA-binding HxlR family transcriptional regulator
LIWSGGQQTWFNTAMQHGYDQFCPIAKAAEVVATRWTPLILRELMANNRTFNDILRGVPLISKAVLATRLQELEFQGIVERRVRNGVHPEYWLTPAGEGLRNVVSALGHWGLVHARDTIRPTDLDPTYLVWGFRKRAMLEALPERRVVIRFEFSGVPANRTKFRIMWLVLKRSGADVCLKDPGYSIDLVFRGHIADFVKVYLGHALWQDTVGKRIMVEGDATLAKQAPGWIRLNKIVGRDFPVVKGAA